MMELEEETILKSGHLCNFKEEENILNGGIEFIVHRKHRQNIIKIDSISSRIVYLLFKIIAR